MLEKLPYRSTIKSRSLFYIETKKLIKISENNLSDSQLTQIIVDDNLFQVNSETRKKEIARTIQLRLQSLDLFLQQQILENNLETGKSIVLYSIIKTDQLFKEFMHEVIYENSITQANQFKDIVINRYFESKKQQSKRVNSWSEQTIYKLKQVYKTILVDAGFIARESNHYAITLPIIDPLVTDHIKKQDSTPFIHHLFGRY